MKRHLLFVHAHPDDESCTTGGTIALHAARGDSVTVVTCTRGEEGKIAVPELQHLHSTRDNALGSYRALELRRALTHLGVKDHRYLICEGRYRDSGRLGSPSNDHPDAFMNADVDAAATWLAGVIDELMPDVVVTYDPNGGYGHPDHIQSHRVTMRALELANYACDHVFWCAVPRQYLRRALTDLESHFQGQDIWVDSDPDHYPDGAHDDALISVAIDVSGALDKKRAALAEHRTQLRVVDDCWILASGRANPIQRTEWYIQVERHQNGEVVPVTCSAVRSEF